MPVSEICRRRLLTSDSRWGGVGAATVDGGDGVVLMAGFWDGVGLVTAVEVGWRCCFWYCCFVFCATTCIGTGAIVETGVRSGIGGTEVGAAGAGVVLPPPDDAEYFSAGTIDGGRCAVSSAVVSGAR